MGVEIQSVVLCNLAKIKQAQLFLNFSLHPHLTNPAFSYPLKFSGTEIYSVWISSNSTMPYHLFHNAVPSFTLECSFVPFTVEKQQCQQLVHLEVNGKKFIVFNCNRFVEMA